MRILSWYQVAIMTTLFLIVAAPAMANVQTNSTATKVEELLVKQKAVLTKAEATSEETALVDDSATSATDPEIKLALETIIQALALAEQGYRHAATLYDTAIRNYKEGGDVAGSTNALLAESAEECADQVRQKALGAKILCDNGQYQSALEEAQVAYQNGQLCTAYAQAGGEEEAGAGLGEQAPPNITPPIKIAPDNPLDPGRNPETASGF